MPWDLSPPERKLLKEIKTIEFFDAVLDNNDKINFPIHSSNLVLSWAFPYLGFCPRVSGGREGKRGEILHRDPDIRQKIDPPLPLNNLLSFIN